jgi:hypothetical protein
MRPRRAVDEPLHKAPRLRISGATLLLPPCASLACYGRYLPLYANLRGVMSQMMMIMMMMMMMMIIIIIATVSHATNT